MEPLTLNPNPTRWLDKPVFNSIPAVKIETLLVTIILILAVVSRFAILGERVMSHDEVNHVVPSYELATGTGYTHDPITHGPFQFHLVALSYFLFGDSDFTSRIPAALFSIATVAFVLFAFRRYIGRSGALIAGFLFLISPYLLFYGRYTRNEAFIALFGVVTLYAVLNYLEKGKPAALYLLTAATALHFAAKETAYIYTALLLVFLAFLFMDRISRARWPQLKSRNTFMLLLASAMILLLLAIGFGAWNASLQPPAVEGEPAEVAAALTPLQIGEVFLVIAALITAVFAVVLLLRSIGWNALKEERSFDLLILVGTLILPQLTAFPVKIVGTLTGLNWNPLDYSTAGIIRTAVFLILLVIISAAIGLAWKPRLWLANFALFYAIFTVLYTTVFTNGFGFFTGIVGSLGYWLDQQAVNRGTQPWYYYAFLQVPIYEFLGFLGALLAAVFGVRHNRFSNFAGESPANSATLEPISADTLLDETAGQTVEDSAENLDDDVDSDQITPPEPAPIFSNAYPLPVLALLLFWSATSLIAYSIAGEKMPWLTVHIALPLLLSAGWGLGYLVDTTDWAKLRENHAWLGLIIFPVFLSSVFGVLGTLLGSQPPFQGNTLDQLRATSTFIFSVIMSVVCFWGLTRLFRGWDSKQIWHLAAVTFFAFLALITIRTSFKASFIAYDQATEFLVYAHAARGPKDVLEQVEEISQRTTMGKNIVVAYVDDALYPYWWYFRDYPNKRWVASSPTRDLRDAPLIIAGDANLSKVDAITRGNYTRFEYMRLWWPMQDYYNLTWERILKALGNPQMRAAIFDIWFNRDYSAYAAATGNQSLTLETWSPSERLYFYIRNDVIAQIWNYGVTPSITTIEESDPYINAIVSLSPDRVVGSSGAGPGQFQAPRGLAIASDSSIYVADSRNHRIQQFSADGQFIRSWGTFADLAQGDAPGGTFNEPWSVAVASDGSVFVADTWNHRIQKFTSDGQFITMWGFFGQAETPEAFWGPRDLAFDSKGRLYVTDTGNKHVVVFDQQGLYLSQFGTGGMDPGQFDEQVGIAINNRDQIFITDTWNTRIQVFSIEPDSGLVTYENSWEVSAWFSNSLDNKPYIAVDNAGSLFITDPEGYRVLQFAETGEFVRGWGDYSPATDGFGLASAVAVDAEGHVWVTDGSNNVLLRFTLP